MSYQAPPPGTDISLGLGVMEEAVTTTKSSPSPPTTAQSPPEYQIMEARRGSHRCKTKITVRQPPVCWYGSRSTPRSSARQVLGTGDRHVDQQHGQGHRNDPDAPAGAVAKPKQQPPPATAQDPEGVPARQGREATSPEEQIVEADDQAEKQQEQEQKRLNKFSNKILLFQAMVFGIFYSGFFLSASSSATQDNNTRVAKAADMLFYIAFLANTVSLGQHVLKLPLQWRRGLAWFTCIWLEISAYLFLVSLNRWYAFAILAFPLFLIVAISITFLMRRKGGDKDDKNLKGIFENSAGLVTGSGLAGAIFGSSPISTAMGSSHFQGSSADHALANLVFCVIAIGLYLMLITTVRSEMLVVHAKHFFNILLTLVIAAATVISTTKFFT